MFNEEILKEFNIVNSATKSYSLTFLDYSKKFEFNYDEVASKILERIKLAKNNQNLPKTN